jgi:transcriptional regulator with XRE-family HTH domain
VDPNLELNGKLIHDLMEEKGLKQNAVAHAANLDPSRLRKIERGEAKNVWLATLGALADALDEHPWDLVIWRGRAIRPRT